MTLFGSKSCPVPWLTAFIEKDNFTLSSRIWVTGKRAAVMLLTSLTQLVACMCVCCCYLSPNDFNPHLFPHIHNFWGVFNARGWHFTHMHQTCTCRVEEKTFTYTHNKIYDAEQSALKKFGIWTIRNCLDKKNTLFFPEFPSQFQLPQKNAFI